MEERMYTRRQVRRAWARYREKMLKQKLLALLMLMIAICSISIDGDITFAVFATPMCIYALCTTTYLG